MGRPRHAHDEVIPPESGDSGTPPAADQLTPAMRQYVEQKQQAGDAILLFRMGDFYELFYDDARLAARLLGIALTSRDGGRTPLAGIPHHALDSYVGKLVAAGCKVAISEQVEDARAARGVIRRELVRIVTPGTLTDEALLDRQRANILAALCEVGALIGVASVELSSGAFELSLCDAPRVVDELARLAPAEVLLAAPAVGRHPFENPIREQVGAAVSYRPDVDFAAGRASELLCRQFEVQTLEGFGLEVVDPALRAAGGLLAYLEETQRTALAHVQPPRRRSDGKYLELDATTLRSLEVERTLRVGSREGALLGAVDLTSNPMGARLLRRWLCYPLRDVAAIENRQRLIAALRGDDATRARLARRIHEVGDLERRIARVALKRTNPRELRAIGDGLAALADMRVLLSALEDPAADALVARLDGLDDAARRLCEQIRPEAPIVQREGGIINAGVDAELDRLRAIRDDGERWLAEYQAREAARIGVPGLKVGFNRVFGYYLEISHAQRQRVPDEYVRKQTVKNAERYITDELKRFESDTLSAEARANELEYALFVAARDALVAHTPHILDVAAAVAEADVLCGWAELALRRDYCRPQFVDAPLLEIDDGRHPVVEQTHEQRFVPNDTRLGAHADRADGERCGVVALITGPNMAGKSTYIRQVALLTLLAHCGCWVPARRMRLGLVDRIFTRVGAADELSRGQSTFMIEMLETANILHNATERSLVILDEVGRGTSTFDGLSLAWAICEHIATRIGCRTLFATHYHELTALADLLEPVFNLNVAVREYEEQVVFLHRIVPGAADRSYGLHVAKLAGISRAVLERAHTVLIDLERTFSREAQRPVLAAAQRRRVRQLRLFEEPEEQVVRELRELPAGVLDGEAAERVRRWRALLESGAPPAAPVSPAAAPDSAHATEHAPLGPLVSARRAMKRGAKDGSA
ncbi:MAG: DNA mismatch repair protein MutS [Phycisphaerae bacterium]|nr:DNA mismatch repair protein MutS [Phycisphaerae bacterium]